MIVCVCRHARTIHTIVSGVCCYLGPGRCSCTQFISESDKSIVQLFPGRSANSDELIQYTADQLDIPYRVSKSDREYCVYYIGMGKDLIELIIMSNLGYIVSKSKSNNDPWYITWKTPTTTHKETLAKFTDLLLLIQLLTEGINVKRAGKAEAYK